MQVVAVIGRVEVEVLPLDGAPEALDEGVIVARPQPSQLMRQPAASRDYSWALLANWLPWSELKMCGVGA